jgi:hypothetical protein
MDRLFQQARTSEVHSIVRGDNRQLVAEAALAAKAIFEGRLLVAKLPPPLYAWTTAKERHQPIRNGMQKAESGPTRIASGRTEVIAKAVIQSGTQLRFTAPSLW